MACRTKGNGHIAIAAHAWTTEEDIADDYPLPIAYEKEEEETDEFLMADEDVALLDPSDLPQRVLADFAIYDSEASTNTLREKSTIIFEILI